MNSGLTPFAEVCRRIRRDKDKLMADQAEALDLSVSFISKLETGNKSIPEGYLDKFAGWLKLSKKEKNELQDAADASVKIVKLRPKDPEQAKLAMEFSRRFTTMSSEEIRKLRETIGGGG